jgi:hypothetical protein
MQACNRGLVEQCTLHLRSDGLSTVKKLPIAPVAQSLTKRKRVWIHEVGMWAENSGSEQAGKVVDFWWDGYAVSVSYDTWPLGRDLLI